MRDFVAEVLEVAAGELARGVCEDPPGSNCGPDVERYLRARGGEPGWRWCGAFAGWCIDEAARRLGRISPLKGLGDLLSALKWEQAGLLTKRWRRQPFPGAVGVLREPDNIHGHVVLIKLVGDAQPAGVQLTTIEGNYKDTVASIERPLSSFRGFVDWRPR